MKSTEPFPETLEELLRLTGLGGKPITQRELSKRIKDRGFDRHHSTFYRIYKGQLPVILAHEDELGERPQILEAIAGALQVRPETFAEYRLWQMRRRFNPKAVGWHTAIRNLQAMERATTKPEEDLDPVDLLDEPIDESVSDNGEARAS